MEKVSVPVWDINAKCPRVCGVQNYGEEGRGETELARKREEEDGGGNGDLRKMLERNLICSPVLSKGLRSTGTMNPIPEQGKKHGNQVSSD